MLRLFVPIIVIYMLFSVAGCQPQKPNETAAVNTSKAVQTENQALTVTYDYTAWKEQAEYDEKDSLTMEDLQLGQLKLRMNSEELTEALQAHLLQVIMEQNGLLEKRFYDGIELQLLSGEVSYISTTSDQYVTPRGLKVGDSVEKLLELYGTPSQIYNNVYSFDLSDEYYLFHAEVKDGKIIRIQVNLAC